MKVNELKDILERMIRKLELLDKGYEAGLNIQGQITAYKKCLKLVREIK